MAKRLLSRGFFAVITLLAGIAFSVSGAFATGGKEAPIVRDRIMVVFHAQKLPANAAQLILRAGGRVVNSLPEVGILVAAPATVDATTLIEHLRGSSAIQAADFDRVMTLINPGAMRAVLGSGLVPETHYPHPTPDFSPTLPADFLYTNTPFEWAVKRIGAEGGGIPGGTSGAWDVGEGAGAMIAILDSGVNPIHPDIAPNLAGMMSETSFGTPCDDGSPYDQVGHGTFTASLVAGAAGPGSGLMIGVAPQAQILSIKVLERVPDGNPEEDITTQCLNGEASGDFAWAIYGIIHAVQAGADVISMSFGGLVPRHYPGGAGAALWSAFNRVTNFATSHGVVLVASAGNDALNLDQSGPWVELPAQAANVIGVVATTNPDLPPSRSEDEPPCLLGQDCLAFYSEYGNSLHGIAAPGGDFPAGGCDYFGENCQPTGFILGACSAGIPGTDYGLPADGKSMG